LSYLEREAFGHADGVSILPDGIPYFLKLAAVVRGAVIVQDGRVRDEDVEGAVAEAGNALLHGPHAEALHVLPQVRVGAVHVVVGGRMPWRPDALAQQLVQHSKLAMHDQFEARSKTAPDDALTLRNACRKVFDYQTHFPKNN